MEGGYSLEALAEEVLVEQNQLAKMEQELQKSEIFKQYMDLRNELNESVQALKDKIKETMEPGKIVKTLGDKELSVNVWESHRIQVENPQEVSDEWQKKVELDNVIVEDGKYYQKVPDTDRVKSFVGAGAEIPQGFTQKTYKSVSIKYDGKTL